MNIEGVSKRFLEICRPAVEHEVATQRDSPEVDHTRLTTNYPDAFTDTHGLRSGRGFIFKTGATWPKRVDRPEAYPYRRELRPVNGHPIECVWDDVLTDIDAYLKGIEVPFTAVMPLGFANVGERKAFCPLLVVIGVEPEKVTFEDAKAAAEYVKLNILTKAGFGDIDVALWEFETFFSASSGAMLPTLDPVVHGHLSKVYHPFASTLGIAIAPLKQFTCEGTLGLFYTHGDGKELMALTAAHVARPPSVFPNNKGVSLTASKRHHEEVAALGLVAFALAVKQIQSEAGNLLDSIKVQQKRAHTLEGRLTKGVDANGDIADSLKEARLHIDVYKKMIRKLNVLHDHITGHMPIPDNRVLGRVLFVDPIGPSSNGPDVYTRDWAMIKLREDAFDDNFQGNVMYIGDKLEEKEFLGSMFPDLNDRDNDAYPEYGLLRLRGFVPLDELLDPKYLDANGDPFMAVVKNGQTTGTTLGRLNGIVAYDNNPSRGAFSELGDSGSVIAERSGRIVGLLTSGGGNSTTGAIDVTFATAYCELEPRIKEIFPNIRLLD